VIEQSKSAKRRYNDGDFHRKYFKGRGLDVGAGVDCLDQIKHAFVGIESVFGWDVSHGDGQYLDGVPDDYFDFVHSSHSLEHMKDCRIALNNWIRVCRPEGFVIVTVPEEFMYEKDCWPSRFNEDHKWSFTLRKCSKMPKTVNVLELALSVSDVATIERIKLIDEFYDIVKHEQDQTLSPNAECCIELILRKN